MNETFNAGAANVTPSQQPQKIQNLEAYRASPDYVSYRVPNDAKNQLNTYKNDPTELNRYALFTRLYNDRRDNALANIGEDSFAGYDGMRQAYNEAYPTTDGIGTLVEEMKAARPGQGASNQGNVTVQQNGAPGGNLPGANTRGALGILHR